MASRTPYLDLRTLNMASRTLYIEVLRTLYIMASRPLYPAWIGGAGFRPPERPKSCHPLSLSFYFLGGLEAS